jgi:fatty-acid desaturase
MLKTHHMIGIAALSFVGFIYSYISDVSMAWLWGTAFVYFLVSCLGVTVTFHRYITHKSFEFKSKLVKNVAILLGCLSGTGDPISWASMHKKHHKHSDTEDDPHGPHLGWRHFVPNYDEHISYTNVKSLIADPYLKFLHYNTLNVILAYYAVLFILGGLPALVFLGFLPQTLTLVVSTLCNYFPHFVGYRNFETNDDSRNTWWLALITWGDSWHNNHHAKPYRYSFSEKWYEFDISGWVIYFLKDRDAQSSSKV